MLPLPVPLPTWPTARPPPALDLAEPARLLLQQIRWEPEQLVQIALYAQMPPAQKVAQMLRIRHHQMNLLRRRLQAEHPAATPVQLAALVRAAIDQYYQP